MREDWARPMEPADTILAITVHKYFISQVKWSLKPSWSARQLLQDNIWRVGIDAFYMHVGICRDPCN